MKNKYYIRHKYTKFFSKILAVLMIAISIFSFELSASAAMNLTARPAETNADTEVSLQWNNVSGAGYYAVTRGTGSSEEIIYVADVNKDLNYLSYIDKGTGDGGLAPETGYTYTVYACRNVVNTLQDLGSENVIDKGTAAVVTAKMLKPVITSAKFNINDRSVMLKWVNNSRATTGVDIGVVSNGSIVKIPDSNVNGGIDYCIISGQDISDGESRQYVVASKDNKGHSSGWSAAVSVTAASAPVVKASVTNGTAVISWGSYPYISNFQLERAKYDINSQKWGAWQVVKPQFNTGTTSTTDILPSAGTYRYRLNARAASGFEGSADAAPELINKPGAPTNLSCKIVEANRIDVSWVNNSDNLSKLLLQKKKSGDADFSTIAELSSSDKTYQDIFSLVRNTTYYYRLVAFDSANNKEVSSECSIRTDIPAAPSMLNLMVEASSITLNWRNNTPSGQQFSFRIQRKVDGENYRDLAVVSSNETRYVDEDGISAGHTYYYRVYAFNPIGSSAYTNEVSTTTAEITVPNSLEVTPVSSSELELTWTYPETGSARTVIERKIGANGSWSIITSSPLASNVTKYTDKGLSPDTQYFYRVRAVAPFNSNVYSRPYPNNDTGVGGYTKIGIISVYGYAMSYNEIYLVWNGVSGASEYTIERKSSSGSFAVVGTVGAGTTSWRDTNLIPNAEYTYRIKAKSLSNESVYSNTVTVANTYLESPTNLIATLKENSIVELEWTDNSTEETGFEIWRCIADTGQWDWSLYKTVGQNVQSFTDTSVEPGIEYIYRVRAFSAYGNIYSSFSNNTRIGAGILIPPTNLRVDNVTENKVTLRWKDNSSDESGFIIERKIDVDGAWSKIGSVSSNQEYYTVKGLNPFTRYFFRVKVYSNTHYSDSYSNEIEVSTGIPEAPSNLILEAVSSTQIRLKWKDNSLNERGFIIERRKSGESVFKEIKRVGADVTTYLDTGLSNDTRYFYRVSAYNNIGTSQSGRADISTRAYVGFNDISNVSWAREAITDLASRGVVSGKSRNSFKPHDTISRAEFACMVVRAFEFSSTPVGSFVDVKPGKWYYNELMSAKAMGIISGDDSNRFNPDSPITREDIAVITVRALKAVDNPLDGHSNSVLEKFHDKNLISSYAIASIASLYGEDVISGKPGNMIGPKDKATRAEAAVIVYRIIDREYW